MYDLTFGMGRDAPFERAPDPALRPARRQLLLARVMAAQASRLGAQLGAGDTAAAAATQVQIMALAGDEQRRAKSHVLCAGRQKKDPPRGVGALIRTSRY